MMDIRKLLYRWVYRDAKTGRYVTSEYAKRDQETRDTTVRERVWLWQKAYRAAP